MGDGLLAEFQSVVAAVEWVADVQRELNERKLKAPGGDIFTGARGNRACRRACGRRRSLWIGRQPFRARAGAVARRAAWQSQMDASVSGRPGGPEVHRSRARSTSRISRRTVRLFVWHPDGVTRPEAADTRSAADLRPARRSSSCRSTTSRARPTKPISPTRWSRKSRRRCRGSAISSSSRAIRRFPTRAARSMSARSAVNLACAMPSRAASGGSANAYGSRRSWSRPTPATTSGRPRVDGAVADSVRPAGPDGGRSRERAPPFDPAGRGRARPLQASRHACRLRPGHAGAAASVGAPHGGKPHAIDLLDRALALEPNYGLAAALGGWARGQQVAYNWATDVAAERAKRASA